MIKIVIIGSGNVASALAGAISKCVELELVQIYARNEANAERIATSVGCEFACEEKALAKADLYIIAVSDVAVGAVSAQLSFGDAVVAHTAGSVDLAAMSHKITNAAVLYPLQTFTLGRELDLSNVPFLIEGRSTRSLECVRAVAQKLSCCVCEHDSERRARVHLAAVFASNFTNHMYATAEAILGSNADAFELLKPLIRETADKALAAPSPRFTQTGPAVRNDFKTKSKHCDMLYGNPDLKNIYITLSKNIWEISKKI